MKGKSVYHAEQVEKVLAPDYPHAISSLCQRSTEKGMNIPEGGGMKGSGLRLEGVEGPVGADPMPASLLRLAEGAADVQCLILRRLDEVTVV